ncbi:MAG: threonine synthase [Acidobacteriaceae bacterium]|nr:threonine synthase [Acidobacteriaceae bacterium]
MGRSSAIECGRCFKSLPANQVLNACQCGGLLLVRYDLVSIARGWPRDELKTAPASMWRYAPVLPAEADEAITLQEGWTPLIRTAGLGRALGAENLFVKDESRNPTGSLKARGACCAVTMAHKQGIRKLTIRSVGNAPGALAAYAAAAGFETRIFMPGDVPQSNFIECKAFGATVTLVDRLPSDSATVAVDCKPDESWLDGSSLQKPYWLEGQKTMGYELAEQCDWKLPDAVVYPCGTGIGLIGIWKAFEEMQELGWIGSARPQMVAVQATGCQPIVRAFEQNAAETERWNNAHTVADGLRVPKPISDFLVLRAIRESHGTAIAISEEEMLDAALLMSTSAGIFAGPEGGACVAAAKRLLKTGFLKSTHCIVLFNTGSGRKYLEAFSTRFPRHAISEQDKLGGLITPR